MAGPNPTEQVRQFQLAQDHLDAGRFDEAARAYLALVDESPAWAEADTALFNAAVCLGKAGRVASSMFAYERLVAEYPRSALAERSLLAVAMLRQRLAHFDEAAQAYERLVAQFPHGEHETAATFAAAVLHVANDRFDEAVRLLRGYARRYKDEDGRASTAMRWSADILRDTGKPEQALKTYYEWREGYAGLDNETATIVIFEITKIELNLGGKRADRAADELLGFEAEGFAEASFLLGELAREKYVAIQPGPKMRTVGQLKAAIERKSRALQATLEQYKKATAGKQPEWALAATYQTGTLYEEFIAYLEELQERASKLNDEYRPGIRETASQITERAVALYRKVVEKSHELGLFTEWTRKALDRLAELDPDRFPRMAEQRPPVEALHLQVPPFSARGEPRGEPGEHSYASIPCQQKSNRLSAYVVRTDRLPLQLDSGVLTPKRSNFGQAETAYEAA